MISVEKKLRKRRIIIISLAILGIILLVTILSFLYSTKDCKSDISCFDRALSQERPAKLTVTIDGNYYQYNLKDCTNKNCNVEIRLLKLKEGSSQEAIDLLEGQKMDCSIPKQNLSATYLISIDQTIDYCTGKLKEGMYELLLRKIYSVIAKNIGSITTEMREALKNK